MTPSDIERVARELGGARARRSGKGWATLCPSHDDREPSLSMNLGESGRLLVKCQAGCSQDAVITAFKARDLWPSAQRAAGKPNGNGRYHNGNQRETVYHYQNADGTLRYQNVRHEIFDAQGKRTQKTFRQRCPDPSGKGFIC